MVTTNIETLKTISQKRREARDKRVYDMWIELTKNPNSARTAIARHIAVMENLADMWKVYRIVSRVKKQLNNQKEKC